VRDVLERADVVSGISRNVVRSLLAVGIPEDKVVHVDPAVDVDRFVSAGGRDEVRRQLDIPNDAVVLLFVGNWNRNKGLDALLDAFEVVAGHVPRAYLVATVERHGGSGLAPAAVPRMYASRTRFLGIVDDLASLMASADLLCVPFRSTDGPSDYPIVIIEAMAAGLPVLATNVGGVSELIHDGDTGWLIPGELQSDMIVSRLLYAIDTVQDWHARQMLVQSAQVSALRRFAPPVVAAQWEAIYDQLRR